MPMSQFMPEIASAHLQPGVQVRLTLEGRVWDSVEPSLGLGKEGDGRILNKKGPSILGSRLLRKECLGLLQTLALLVRGREV